MTKHMQHIVHVKHYLLRLKETQHAKCSDIMLWYVKWLQVRQTSDQSSAPYMYVRTCNPYIKQV